MKIPGVIHCATCSSSSVNIAVVLVFFRLLIISGVDGFSNVIPISDCSPMESIHGVQPQLGNPPFFTYTDKVILLNQYKVNLLQTMDNNFQNLFVGFDMRNIQQVVTNNNGDAVQLRLTIKQRSLGEETAFKGTHICSTIYSYIYTNKSILAIICVNSVYCRLFTNGF